SDDEDQPHAEDGSPDEPPVRQRERAQLREGLPGREEPVDDHRKEEQEADTPHRGGEPGQGDFAVRRREEEQGGNRGVSPPGFEGKDAGEQEKGSEGLRQIGRASCRERGERYVAA